MESLQTLNSKTTIQPSRPVFWGAIIAVAVIAAGITFLWWKNKRR